MLNRSSAARTTVAGVLMTSVLAMAAAPVMAVAQDYPDDQYASEPVPPQGEYAPPPEEYDENATYDPRYQQYDRAYGDYASSWAYENCVRHQQGNAVAGAIIGGALGAVVGSNVAGRHDRTEGAIVGGALGATAGAAIGSNAGSGAGCPPGYVLRAGAAPFAYGGPVYGPSVYYAPAWYRPWVWSGGRYVYRPYRSWYWTNGKRYWNPRKPYKRYRRVR